MLALLSPEAAQALQLPPGVTLKKCAFEPGKVALSVALKLKTHSGVVTSGQADLVKPAALLFLSAYQVLNLARRVHKSSS